MEIGEFFRTVLAQTITGFASAASVIAARCDGRGCEMCFSVAHAASALRPERELRHGSLVDPTAARGRAP